MMKAHHILRSMELWPRRSAGHAITMSNWRFTAALFRREVSIELGVLQEAERTLGCVF